MAWFQDNNVGLLAWPGNSPDINSIENLWAGLKKLVALKKTGNRRELIQAIIDALFHVITPEHLGQLVDSMPKRDVKQLSRLKAFQRNTKLQYRNA